ncbi:MAG TPA: hypothetical protein VFG27_17305 [Pseudomonadales bacterium]|nr:hypothetical protein [Pseudomonadales bacterium]
MTDQLELLTRLETYVGAAFVAFYGFERFRKPPSEPGARQAAYPSRATTTAASYYTAVFLYCGIGVLLYGTLLFSPSVLEKIWALVPQLGDEVPSALRQSPSVVVALLLTVLLSKVPALAALDTFVRTRLQHMAAIPHEVRRMAVELKRAAFRPASDAEYAEIAPSLLAQGFDEADVRNATGDTLMARWLRLVTLMRRMEAWEAEGGLNEYFIDCPGELDGLRERYREIGAKVRRAYGFARGPAAEAAGAPDARALEMMAAYREDVAAALDALIRDLHDAISRAVLLSEFTEHRRARRLGGLGFELGIQPVGHISLNSLMMLFTAGSVLFMFGFTVLPSRRPDESPVDLVLRSVMIAAIYCVSLWCALGPKTYWASARRAAGSTRPWCAYLLSALAAAVGGAAVSLGTKVLYHANFAEAWARFGQGFPWIFLTFAVAYAVAALADDEPADLVAVGLGGRPQWLVEAAVMVAVMVPVSLLVYRLLLDTTPLDRMPALTQVVVTVGIVSFSIGALVPRWYRDAPSDKAGSRLVAAAAPAGI